MSGGLDSTVRLYWAKANFDTVQAITFNYYHRLNREKVALHSIARLDLAMERKTSRIQNV
jgi:7-cyano-7-deazaguanine synthase in queuosine biosynthesis